MIYKFRMLSGEDKAFLRDYEIDAEDSFINLHKQIQNNLHFDSSQLASFFLTDEQWNKGLELTLLDMRNDSGPVAIPMESIKITDLIKKRNQRLLYVYDILTDNALFLELLDVFPAVKGVKYPICSASIGDAPEQSIQDIDEDNMTDESVDDILRNFEINEFGSEGYDGDDS